MVIRLPQDARFTAELAQAFGTALQDLIPARLGDPLTRLIRVPDSRTDRAGLLYIHGIGADPQGVHTAINNLPFAEKFLVYGLPVLVRKENQRYVIEKFDQENWAEFFKGVVGIHDQVPVLISQLFYGTLQPTPSGFNMKAMVIGAVYGGYRVPDTPTADFSTAPLDTSGNPIYIPTMNNRAIGVLVQVTPATGALSYKQGAQFNASLSHAQAFDAGYYPAADDLAYRIGYIRLTAGMSAINHAAIYNAPELYSKSSEFYTYLISPHGARLVTTAGQWIILED